MRTAAPSLGQEQSRLMEGRVPIVPAIDEYDSRKQTKGSGHFPTNEEHSERPEHRG